MDRHRSPVSQQPLKQTRESDSAHSASSGSMDTTPDDYFANCEGEAARFFGFAINCLKKGCFEKDCSGFRRLFKCLLGCFEVEGSGCWRVVME